MGPAAWDLSCARRSRGAPRWQLQVFSGNRRHGCCKPVAELTTLEHPGLFGKRVFLDVHGKWNVTTAIAGTAADKPQKNAHSSYL